MKKLYFILLLLIASCGVSQAQKFWLLTYEFPGREKTGIAGSADTFLYTSLTNGVLRSSNEGYHWDTVFLEHGIYSLYANDSGLVLAGGRGQIFRSLDYGTTWDSAATNSTYPIRKFVQDVSGNLYAINGMVDAVLGYLGNGVYYSGNKGQSWELRNNGLGGYHSCDGLATDKNGRLYVTAKDENVDGSAGLYISENQGQQWEHLNIKVDGDGVVGDDMKVHITTGLSVSPEDSVYFSFDGVTEGGLVKYNVCKHISDIRSSSFWTKMRVASGPSWWLDRLLNNIHFARNGDRYSSTSGTTNSGGTAFLKKGASAWVKHNQGLGLDMYGLQGVQTFYEKSSGKVFMVQYMDERVYWQDTSLITLVPNPENTEQRLVIYPNPISTNSSMSVAGLNENEAISITITDLQGRLVKEVAVEHTSINAPALPGIYLLAVRQNGRIYNTRLIVQ